MARLFANENLPVQVTNELRTRGHDVITVADIGLAGTGLADAEVLRIALRERRAVVTLNRRHFIKLHLDGTPHCGIIVCTFDRDYAGLATRIDN